MAMLTLGFVADAVEAQGMVARRVEQGPVVDGRADDACWREAERLPLRYAELGEPMTAGGAVALCFDAENLYAALWLDEPAPEKMRAPGEAEMWKGEVLEWFICSRPDGKEYVQLAWNPAGARFGGRFVVQDDGQANRDRDWRPKWRAAARTGAKGWTAEAAISFAELRARTPADGTAWTMNLARTRQIERTEYSALSPVGKRGFHQPERFLTVWFGRRGEVLPSAAKTRPPRIKVDLEPYWSLDRRDVSGTLAIQCPDPVQGALELDLRVTKWKSDQEVWRQKASVPVAGYEFEWGFALPASKWGTGYYELQVAAPWDKDGVAAGERRRVVMAVAGTREAPVSTRGGGYAGFVVQTMEKLIQNNSARWGGDPKGTLALTVSNPMTRSYLSLGEAKGDTFQTYWFPSQPMEMEPSNLDMDLWPVLEMLSARTGDARWGEMASAMAAAFARDGFDPRSGLGYLGTENNFDVVQRGPRSRMGHGIPHFKPKNDGNCLTLPLDLLWSHAPAQMARMFRSMFYGLVTDGASMDYNRFCRYNYDDRDRKPSMERSTGHCAFDTAGGRMIHWWASCWARTGDAECLAWAQRMADKWQAVQHPESGLIPNFFGGVEGKAGDPMPPGKWCESRGAAQTASAWLDAVGELRKRPGGEKLAAQLTDMATRLARGVARHTYDAQERVFREHRSLDGTPWLATGRYTFPTQEAKDAAIKKDPKLARAAVWDGGGFYRHGGYWQVCAGTSIPYWLAQAAARTRDAELLDRVRRMAADAMDEARKVKGEFTEEGLWTFHASAQYIKTFLLLSQATGDPVYRQWARELADREIRLLSAIECPDWWRLPERAALLEALLELDEATRQ